MFLAKTCQFFNLNLIKISLETMLSDFAEKKLFDLKKQNFSNSKTSHFFKGVNLYFWPKNAIFSLFRFDQNKTRNNAF